MSRCCDSREREDLILELIIKSYISESKPISSQYLCQKYDLKFSPATVRNAMVALEKKGYIVHLHTSSGRVPTKEGYKYYVYHLKQEEIISDHALKVDLLERALPKVDEFVNYAMDTLSEMTGYTSILAFSPLSAQSLHEDQFLCRGTRFILNQPEFEDLKRLKKLFYALEVKIHTLQELMLENIDQAIKIMVGDELGLDEVDDCSLIVSGSQDQALPFALAVIGPIRMDYIRAASNLYMIKNQLHDVVKDILDRV